MNRVTHFEIYTDDPEAVQPFYQDVFGWKFQKFESEMPLNRERFFIVIHKIIFNLLQINIFVFAGCCHTVKTASSFSFVCLIGFGRV
jgi:hypothetical protein